MNPDENPRDLIRILVAAGLRLFGNPAWTDENRFDAAENFVAEAEKRYGKLNK